MTEQQKKRAKVAGTKWTEDPLKIGHIRREMDVKFVSYACHRILMDLYSGIVASKLFVVVACAGYFTTYARSGGDKDLICPFRWKTNDKSVRDW
mmetsp:Transcript_11465/g.15290  ORF Transcript_11465/g.15290 Transcript_11465/m.15290 type:complete len:94 (-) Transcript_11465:180-461(-)